MSTCPFSLMTPSYIVNGMVKKNTKKHPLKKRLVIISLLVLAILITTALGLYIWFKTNPYLSAMLIRNSFEKGGTATNVILEKYAPKTLLPSPISTIDLTIRMPTSMSTTHPKTQNQPRLSCGFMVAAGWPATKNDLSPWARILAGKGFNVIALNYSLAPEKKYPLPTVQANAALHYFNDHADELRLNPNKLIIGGDSAGAQIAAQIALIETNPDYARKIGLTPGLTKKIAALLLNCGPYDLSLVNPESTSDGAKLVRTFLWAYTGKKDFFTMDGIALVSIPPYVTANFPPRFITAGNIDPLLPHSKVLATALKKTGVTTDTLFYPDDYTPALNHEYQFNLDTKEGMNALDRMVKFSFEQTAK